MTGPEHYREAERLVAESYTILRPHDEGPCEADRLLVAAQVHATLALVAAQTAPPAPQLETEPAVAYVYRAAWGPVPMGTYTNQAAARTHCTVDATNNADDPSGLSFDWIGDESEPDAPYELVVEKDGSEETTDYTVTRITVAAEYDPEADA
ncbi:hypothetical protein [Streptomyces sp. rh34]|uniref:hypothetical protein n=1 Tax=Streptomyces sp. rh34 TaxID=2034272 RepID=UPI000BF1523C|nr:hypothetical protein [Streptomyces sp. rh34]